MANLKNTTIDDTGFLQIPRGTTAERPASPELGMMRFNTDEEYIEFYNGEEWLRLGEEPLPDLASVVYPNTVVGYPDLNASSFSDRGTNWVAYTDGYDGRFVNEWDILSDIEEPGANGAEPGNLSSNLGRSVPNTWSSLKNNADRQGVDQGPERQRFPLFVVGRDCPSDVTEINVIAFGGAPESGLSNYATASFTVEPFEAFRVVVGNGGGLRNRDGTRPGADGLGGGSPDGDDGDRTGGGGTGMWFCGINRDDTSKNRFIVAGGGGNQSNTVQSIRTNSRPGDDLYGPQYGLQPNNNSGEGHDGGGPGAGGNSDTSTFGGTFNSGTGSANRSQAGERGDRRNGYGGGTGGDGADLRQRDSGGVGGFAYNRVGLAGGAGQFGGGGGWNGGGGGWGGRGSAGSGRVIGANSSNEGTSPGGSISNQSLSGLGFPYTGEFNRSHPSNYADGFLVVWW